MKKPIKFEDIKSQWMKDYDLGLEYEIALELIQARINAGLTQEEIAIRMGTTHSVVARLEAGRVLPSVKILTQYATATGKHLCISLEPSRNPR